MASLQNNNYNSNSDRQYKCKFFIDENDFTAISKDSLKKCSPNLEKNMFFCDIPKSGEVLLLSPYHNFKADLYQIETVYRHLYGISGRMVDIEIEYRILMKLLYVATRIVMVEKYKAPIYRVLPTGEINRNYYYEAEDDDYRNYYYEAEDDDYEIAIDEIDTEEIEVNDAFTQMPF